MKRIAKILLKIAGGLLVLVSVALVSGYIYINSASGKDWLAQAINTAASDPKTGASVAVTGIEGSIPWDIRIRNVSLGDAQGEYASLAGLHFSWDASALLHKQIHIIALEADAIDAVRAPLLPPSNAPPAKPQPFSIPKVPDILVDTLHITKLSIGAALAGSDQRFSIDGGGTPADWKLGLKTLEGPETTLNLNVNLLPSSMRAEARLDEAPGGVILHMLKQTAPGPLHLDLNADTDTNGLVHLQGMSLTFNGLALKGQGSYRLADRKSDVQLNLSLADGVIFADLAGTPLAGKLDATLAASGPPEALAVKLDAALSNFVAGKTPVPDARTEITAQLDIPQKTVEIKNSVQATVNGAAVHLAMEAALRDTHVTVTHFAAGYGPYRAEGNLEADQRSRDFKLSLTSPLPPLAVIAPQLHLEASGQSKLEAEGAFDAFKINLKTEVTSKEGNATLLAKGEVAPAKQSFEGRIDLDTTRDGQHFRLALPVKANATEAILSDASLEGPGIKLAATLHWLIAEKLGDAALTLHASDLRPLGILAGQKLAGHVDADVALSAQDKKESARLKLNAGDIDANGVTLTQAELASDAQDIFGHVRLNAKLNAGTLVSGTTRMEKLKLNAGGTSDAMTATLNTNGSAGGKPFSVALDGDTRRDAKAPDTLHVTVKKFEGVYDAAPIELAQPVDLQVGPNRFTLSSLLLKVADGEIAAGARQKDNTLSGQLTIKHLHIDKLPVAGVPQGTADARMNLKGTLAAPEVNLTSTLAVTQSGQPVLAHANVDWRKGSLQLKSDASVNGSKVHADIAMHAPLSLSPFSAGVNGATTMKGDVTIDAALESLNGFLRGSGQRVSGKVAGDVKVAGKLAAPDLQGKVTLSNGQYAQEDSGVCVKGMHAEIEGSGDHVALRQFDAASADGGTLYADASATLTGAKALQGRVALHNYRLFCGGMASGTIEGDLTLAGTLDAAQLGGTLTFPRMNVELPGNAAGKGNIPVVETSRADPGARKVNKPAAPPGTGNAPLKLGVNIHVPGKMFIRGRGLDAEFKGDLAIKGPADNPSVIGLFESKRGQFELLDKTLKLLSAEIRFEGTIPPSPFLDIKAESVTSDITIDVNVSGPAAKPELTMSSTPALPQDQILAQLLFGRDLSSLGPFQVAQLAQATATLAGYESGPGVLGKVRSFLGIDTLNVGTDTSNDMNVGAGKYVTDKIYVGVTQGAKPESRAVTTEIEVYPHVSATTGVTADGQQNLGMQWKYDY